MRSLRAILLYLVFVFIGGALLAPWLYWLVQALGDSGESLARQPFHRYVSRCFLFLALAGLWPFLRALGIRSWGAVGLSRMPGRWRQLGRGFALGFVSLAVVALVTLAFNARELKIELSASKWLRHLLNAGMAAVVVGFLEELLFRGALFGALRRERSLLFALAGSSGLYALLHYFQRPAAPAEVNWLTGLALLPAMLRGFTEVSQLVPGFFNLALAGAILGIGYHRTGSLFFSIGLHAGWIFWLKSYAAITREVPGGAAAFWGTGRLIDGWFAMLVLGFVALLVSSKLRAGSHAAPGRE